MLPTLAFISLKICADSFMFICCHGDVGLRHIAILKLVGTETPDMGGVLELYPINGKKLLINGTVSQATQHNWTSSHCCTKHLKVSS